MGGRVRGTLLLPLFSAVLRLGGRRGTRLLLLPVKHGMDVLRRRKRGRVHRLGGLRRGMEHCVCLWLCVLCDQDGGGGRGMEHYMCLWL